MMNDPVKCPKCQEPISADVVAHVANRSVVKWKLSPAPGELLDAKAVGGTLGEMRDLLRSCGESAGIPTEVLLQACRTTEDGAMEFDLLIVRLDEAVGRRKRFAARKRARKEAE